jgi:hypothetical protein
METVHIFIGLLMMDIDEKSSTSKEERNTILECQRQVRLFKEEQIK